MLSKISSQKWTSSGKYCIFIYYFKNGIEFMKLVCSSCILTFLLELMVAGAGASSAFGADKTEPAAQAAEKKHNVQQIIFEEQKIEGKIRRPQMVLIKADQRPAFSPMVMPSLGRNDNFVEFVDQSVIDKMPNQEPFQFEGMRIANYVK
jgi:hypothetical protein